ncbi:MAG: penicillin-binding protein 1C, partial [Alphaproteobacteria bacterium]
MKRIASTIDRVRQMLPASRGLRWTVYAFAAMFVLMVGALATYRIAMVVLGPPPFASVAENSRLVVDRDGRLLRPFTTSAGIWRLPVKLADIDPRYIKMLLAYEDKRYYEHSGVDFRAMLRAVWQLISNGYGVSGGSTLTMQTARLLDKRPTRSYIAKIGQVFRAWQLESMMSKEKILELYMRIAPFGGNIEGARAASLAYFGKEPKRLTIAEAALLVSLPQSPERRRPDRGHDITRIARNQVLDRVAAAGVISQAEADYAKMQPVLTRRHSFPALAAHLSERLAAASDDDVLRLTLKARLQQGIETIARRHAIEVGPKLSVAVMVVEHRTGEVLAHVGSAGYFDNDRNGPIDMTQAVRSPGSALKPFIYGLGFEAGLAHPETLIEDRPTHFGRYAPKNFDNSYRGTVTVRQALQHSLNIPAVKMLAAINPARLSSRIRHAGFKFEVPRNLAVALGGVGLRLEDLTGLYVALARGGEPVALRYRLKPGEGPAHPDDVAPTSSEQPLLSPLASWYVGNILRGAPPPPHA